MHRSAFLISVRLLAIALRLVVGAALGGLGTLIGRLAEWVLAAVGGVWLIATGRRSSGAPGWLLVAAAGAIVGPALVVGLPLVRYRVPADPIFIIWMVAGVAGRAQPP